MHIIIVIINSFPGSVLFFPGSEVLFHSLSSDKHHVWDSFFFFGHNMRGMAKTKCFVINFEDLILTKN